MDVHFCFIRPRVDKSIWITPHNGRIIVFNINMNLFTVFDTLLHRPAWKCSVEEK